MGIVINAQSGRKQSMGYLARRAIRSVSIIQSYLIAGTPIILSRHMKLQKNQIKKFGGDVTTNTNGNQWFILEQNMDARTALGKKLHPRITF